MDRPSILFVDDEPDILQVCVELIRSQRPGWDAEHAGTAADALERMRRCVPDVLATDYRMPRTDGLELAAAASRLEPRPACLLMTAYADVEIARRARDTGHVDAFLLKPFEPLQMLDALDLMVAGERVDPARRSGPLDLRFDSAVEQLGDRPF